MESDNGKKGQDHHLKNITQGEPLSFLDGSSPVDGKFRRAMNDGMILEDQKIDK